MSAKETHPYFFQPDLGIDRRKCKRVVPMQVLALGMSRTGTTSIREALQILGYTDVYHAKDAYPNVQDADMLLDGLNAKYFGKGKPFGRAEFDKLFGHCEAVTAGPANCFGTELIDAYPDAKVVLVERDFDAWLKSFGRMLDRVDSKMAKLLAFLDPWWMGKLQAVGNVWLRGQFGASTAEGCRANARKVYEEHYRDIREAIPKDRLLEYQLGDGWRPLCQFLGKEVPDVPFPRLNEAAMFERQMQLAGKKAMRRSLQNVAVIGSTLAALGVSLCWMVRRMW